MLLDLVGKGRGCCSTSNNSGTAPATPRIIQPKMLCLGGGTLPQLLVFKSWVSAASVHLGFARLWLQSKLRAQVSSSSLKHFAVYQARVLCWLEGFQELPWLCPTLRRGRDLQGNPVEGNQACAWGCFRSWTFHLSQLLRKFFFV